MANPATGSSRKSGTTGKDETVLIENDRPEADATSEENPDDDVIVNQRKRRLSNVSTDSSTIYNRSIGQRRMTPAAQLRWYQKISMHAFVDGVVSLMRRLTAFPMLTSSAIYFDEDDRFDPAGNRKAEPSRDSDAPVYPSGERLEIDVNYEKATLGLFEAIIRYRKEAKFAKDNYHTVVVDMSGFKDWDEAQIDRLRFTFQAFDASGDGLVDFEEFCTTLDEFGDETTSTIRKSYFDTMDDGSGSIDFMQFLQFVYKITKKTPGSPGAQELSDTFQSIDRNMARIRSLDVVQQLQAGLF